MLNNVTFKATFSSTGKTLQGNHNLTSGMTAITGANETGKSFVLEMIRYALFGSRALRATTKSYETLKSEVTFTIEGNPYTISRGISGQDILYKGDTPTASGTKPVNSAIEKLFGYNLEVFDISNACLQGQVESLSDKTPADRKRMVDKVIGLDTVDAVIKKYGAKISEDKHTCEALQSTIVIVEKPQELEKYLSPQRSTEELNTAMKEYEELQSLKAELEASHLEEPKTPVISIVETLEQLEIQCSLRLKSEAARNQVLFEMKGLPTEGDELGNHEARLTACEDYSYYVRQLESQPKKPGVSKEEIIQQEELNFNIKQNEKAEALKSRIDKLNNNSIACPKCSHEFALENNLVLELEKELTQLEETLHSVTIIPTYNPTELQRFTFAWEEYDDASIPALVEDPGETVKQVVQSMEFAKYRELEIKLTSIEEYPDKSEEYKTRLAEDAEMKAHVLLEIQYNKFKEKQPRLEKRIQELQGSKEAYEDLRALIVLSRVFDNELDNYTKQVKIMKDRQDRILILEDAIFLNKNIQKSLKDLKPKVKLYLVPSLNKVASSLISQMTNGERSVIKIDEQFNIMVDNQVIEELSGSGKSVANLAIRIGLGTVLTNKVFSVFLADEIDAAMDNSRAAYTAECLRNLNSTVKQIILVSHQEPEADHYITLRK